MLEVTRRVLFNVGHTFPQVRNTSRKCRLVSKFVGLRIGLTGKMPPHYNEKFFQSNNRKSFL